MCLYIRIHQNQVFPKSALISPFFSEVSPKQALPSVVITW